MPIADGYYLYRDKIKFVVTPDGAVLGAPELPAGKVKTDEFFGKVETYRGTVVVKLPLTGAAAGQSVVLAADSQGCADVGVCYPPTRQKLSLGAAGAGQPARGAGRRDAAEEELVPVARCTCTDQSPAVCWRE